MEVKIQKGSELWMFFQDYYKFIQLFGEAEDEEFFETMTDCGQKLYEKYKGTEIEELTMNLILDWEKEIDRRYAGGAKLL